MRCHHVPLRWQRQRKRKTVIASWSKAAEKAEEERSDQPHVDAYPTCESATLSLLCSWCSRDRTSCTTSSLSSHRSTWTSTLHSLQSWRRSHQTCSTQRVNLNPESLMNKVCTGGSDVVSVARWSAVDVVLS